MTTRAFAIGLIIVAALQTVALATMIARHERDLARGREVLLKSEMRDPRDFFRGNYTRLNLAISRLDRKQLADLPPNLKPGMEIFAVLEEGEDGFWTVELLQTQAGSQTVLRGRIAGVPPVTTDGQHWLIIDFPFTRYYAPEKRALELEDINRQGELGILVSVLPDGAGMIKGLTIGGKKIYDERLF